MLSWVLRHRHQLRTLYGLPPEPALAALIALERKGDGSDEAVDVDAPRAPRPAAARGRLPQVVLSPARRRP